jgi:hypothetical protein
MVSAWWLLAAFWLGGCLGMLLTGLLASMRKSSASDDDEVPVNAQPRTAVDRRY